MNAATRQQAKDRWIFCGQLAEKLGCSKHHVHDRLYRRIKATPAMLDAVIRGDKRVISEIKAWPEFSQTTPTVIQRQKSKRSVNISDLRLALWLIGKIGSVEKAKKTFDAAIVATRAMQND